MPKRSGRPTKGDENNSKEKIIEATVSLLRNEGASAVTVRSVCAEAELSVGTFYHYFRDKDDLFMHFLRETSFDSFELETPLSDIAGRTVELYLHLIHRYMGLGLDFMKSFYSTENHSLSAYMEEKDGSFTAGTVMARSEEEMVAAQKAGYLEKEADPHALCADICTIVKGAVFEWCLSGGNTDIENILLRIVRNYLANYLTSPKQKNR